MYSYKHAPNTESARACYYGERRKLWGVLAAFLCVMALVCFFIIYGEREHMVEETLRNAYIVIGIAGAVAVGLYVFNSVLARRARRTAYFAFFEKTFIVYCTSGEHKGEYCEIEYGEVAEWGFKPELRSDEEISNVYLPGELENQGDCRITLTDGTEIKSYVRDIEGIWKELAQSVQVKGEIYLPVSGFNRP